MYPISVNTPGPYTAAQLNKFYPSGLELEQVQILLRHGERTPGADRMSHLGLPRFWPLCSGTNPFTDAVLSATPGSKTGLERTEFQYIRKFETPNADGEMVMAASKGADGYTTTNVGLCGDGDLTDLGRQTTLAFGQRVRQRYVTQLGFLPKKLSDYSELYLRSTPIVRTHQSLVSAFTGLYPVQDRAADLPPVSITTRRPHDETYYPNSSVCHRLAELRKEFSMLAAKKWDNSPELDYLSDKIGKYTNPHDGERVKVLGSPRISGILDTVVASKAHESSLDPLPAVFYEEKVLNLLSKVMMDEWMSGHVRSRESRILNAGPIGSDIITRMMGAVGKQDEKAAPFNYNAKLAIAACHDITIATVLYALGAADAVKTWPAFTSHLTFEMFRKKDGRPSSSSSSESVLAHTLSTKPLNELSVQEKAALEGRYVRVIYNDEFVNLPGCDAVGNHLEGDKSMCTLAAFKDTLDEFRSTNFKKECKSNLGRGIIDLDE